jgi:REP element-mobilizing transposase RayT
MIIQKKHRLEPALYHGMKRVTFTICAERNYPVFKSKQVVNNFLKILKEVHNKYGCINWIYVFMPDHMHFISEGQEETSDVLAMVKMFKQRAGFWLSKNEAQAEASGYPGTPKLQKSFYDHIHRSEDDLQTHIKYILENPVRKNIVENWKDYPFQGSLDYEIEDLIEISAG